MAGLWDNFVGPPGTQGGFSGYFELGLKFHPSIAQDIHALAWKPANTTTSDKPAQLDLWDHATGTLVASTSAVTHDGTTNWQLCPLANVYTASPGQVLEVAGWFPTGTHMATSATQPPAVTGLVFDSPGAVQAAFGVHAEPTSTSSFFWMVDIRTVASSSTGGSGGVTATPGDVQSSLADWLISTSDNLHQTDGLPWLTKTVADAVKVVTDKLGASGSGNSLDWIVSLWRLAGDLTDAEIGLLKALLTHQSQVIGASGGGGSAFYGPSGTQVAAGVETLLASGLTTTDLGAAVALLRERLTLSPDLADTSRWTLVDTTSGDGDALISQQADAYFLSITAYPASQAAHGVASTLWLPRWGWVCPRVHGHFAQRQFHDVMPTIVTSEGHFMDGLLIYTPQGFEWTCESYVLDR